MDFLSSAFSQHAPVVVTPKWQVLLGVLKKTTFVMSFYCSFNCSLVQDHTLNVQVAVCVPAALAFKASLLLLAPCSACVECKVLSSPHTC